MGEPCWESQVHWDDGNRATHQGVTFELWSHGYQLSTSSSGEPVYSTGSAWHLHELRSGEVCEESLSGPLCITRREAARLAELWILGWRPEPGYRDMWRAPDQKLHAIGEVLSGATPH